MSNYKRRAKGNPFKVGQKVKYISFNGIWQGIVIKRVDNVKGCYVKVWIDFEYKDLYGDYKTITSKDFINLEVVGDSDHVKK